MEELSPVSVFIIFSFLGGIVGFLIAKVQIAYSKYKTKKRLTIDEMITYNSKARKTKEESWPDRPAAELRAIILEDLDK